MYHIVVFDNWDTVYNSNNINSAYDDFLKIFKILYGKNCPVEKINRKPKYADYPWITKGLQNACKRKIHYTENV